MVQWPRSICQCRGHEFNSRSRKIPHVVEQLSPCTTAAEARVPQTHQPQQEKPSLCSWRVAPTTAEKPHSRKTQFSQI